MNSWMKRGLCREVGSEPFFGDQGSQAKKAKSICATCEVTQQCLEYALSLPLISGHPVKGVWGGTTEMDRRQLRRLQVAS